MKRRLRLGTSVQYIGALTQAPAMSPATSTLQLSCTMLDDYTLKVSVLNFLS